MLECGRREFLRVFGGGALSAMLPAGKKLQGIFPIAQTPFTSDNKLDVDSLVAELRFVDRGGVRGFVWPQLASEWASLTEQERLGGAEAILAEAKKLRPAVVIGVQAPQVSTALNYARHAAKNGADALIALPPSDKAGAQEMLNYYHEIGSATDLPLFVQAVGDMSVQLIIQLWKEVPTIRYVKDEAGRPLDRIAPLREKSRDELKVFSGSHGRTLIEEMRRGISGSMPAASFADLYASTWDLWQQGKHREAMEMHGRTLLLLTEMTNYGFEAMKYILCLRGVFKTYEVRSGRGQSPLNDQAKESLRETLDAVRGYLRA